jgi:hypothetical protein
MRRVSAGESSLFNELAVLRRGKLGLRQKDAQGTAQIGTRSFKIETELNTYSDRSRMSGIKLGD